MKSLSTLAVAFALFALPSVADEKTVTYKSGDETVSSFVAAPEGKGPFPACVSRDPGMVGRERLGEGPGPGWRRRATWPSRPISIGATDSPRGKKAHQLMMEHCPTAPATSGRLPPSPGLAPRTGQQSPHRPIGWCMGGRYSLAMATEEPTLAAVVAYYGAPPTEPAAIARIKAPVLGNYGALDKGPSPEQVKEFEAALKKAEKRRREDLRGRRPRFCERQQSLEGLQGRCGQRCLGTHGRVPGPTPEGRRQGEVGKGGAQAGGAPAARAASGASA